MNKEHPSGTLGHVSTCRFKDRNGKIHTFQAKTTGIIGAVETEDAPTDQDSKTDKPADKTPGK